MPRKPCLTVNVLISLTFLNPIVIYSFWDGTLCCGGNVLFFGKIQEIIFIPKRRLP